MYIEDWTTLIRETDTDTNRWKDVTCSGVWRITIAYTHLQLKAMRRFNVIPISIPLTFFNKKNSTVQMEPQKRQNNQKNLKKEKHKWVHQTSCFQVILICTHSGTEQKNKASICRSTDFHQGCWEDTARRYGFFRRECWRKLLENETAPSP